MEGFGQEPRNPGARTWERQRTLPGPWDGAQPCWHRGVGPQPQNPERLHSPFEACGPVGAAPGRRHRCAVTTRTGLPLAGTVPRKDRDRRVAVAPTFRLSAMMTTRGSVRALSSCFVARFFSCR